MLSPDHTQPQGLDAYAHPDPFVVRLRQSFYRHQVSYYGALIWTLRHGDDEAAGLIATAQAAMKERAA